MGERMTCHCIFETARRAPVGGFKKYAAGRQMTHAKTAQNFEGGLKSSYIDQLLK